MNDSAIDARRIRLLGSADPGPDGEFVLYWMTTARRFGWNHSLQRAVEWSSHLGVGLVILEALRCDYPWASQRFHRFAIDGMGEHSAALTAKPGVLYYPYLEAEPGAGRGLLAELARRAAVVVTDDYPTFFVPSMLRTAAHRVAVAFEAVDSNGLLPMRAAGKVYPSAYTFRRFLQKTLPTLLDTAPQSDPLPGLTGLPTPRIPSHVLTRWPAANFTAGEPDLAKLPVDDSVAPTGIRGGPTEARSTLRRFLAERLSRYDEDRNKPELEATSGLSPYLHFGHVSAHEVFQAVVDWEGWKPFRLGTEAAGKRSGWWGMSEPAEAFLDQLVTWRELGFNMAALEPGHREYDTLPEWARATLDHHASDPREHTYSHECLEGAETHDELWNAAQRQLVREGRIHNYLRMLWGKKILEWTESPREAARIMIDLNDRYALDGRDPNSYSGIYWCLGRYDRPWGPERPIFGKIRFMSSTNTARKVRVREYLERFGP